MNPSDMLTSGQVIGRIIGIIFLIFIINFLYRFYHKKSISKIYKVSALIIGFCLILFGIFTSFALIYTLLYLTPKTTIEFIVVLFSMIFTISFVFVGIWLIKAAIERKSSL